MTHQKGGATAVGAAMTTVTHPRSFCTEDRRRLYVKGTNGRCHVSGSKSVASARSDILAFAFLVVLLGLLIGAVELAGCIAAWVLS